MRSGLGGVRRKRVICSRRESRLLKCCNVEMKGDVLELSILEERDSPI